MFYLWQCEWYECAGWGVEGVDLLRHLAQYHGEGQVEGDAAVRVHYYHLEIGEERRGGSGEEGIGVQVGREIGDGKEEE